MERNTRQREAIRAVFDREERPLSPHEVLAMAQSRVPSMGIATVYRNLKVLLEEGSLRVVELPGEGSRYERAGKRHHHHFQCRACGRVFEVEGCPGGFHALVPAGFELEQHEVVLYGRCADCLAGPAR